MKKFVFKATALAIGALVGGSAVAAPMNITSTVVITDSATPANSNTGAKTYAKELRFDAGLTGGNNITGGANGLNVITDIGFGVSNGQTRYIRLDLTNAKFSATSFNAAACAGRDLEIAGKVDRDNGVDTTACNADDVLTGAVSLVQGGANDQAYVVYQITAGADIAAGDDVKIALANIKVADNSASVKVKYSLHETATSAQGTTASNTALLSSGEADLAKFASGVTFSVAEVADTTASVEKSFTEFKAGGGQINATTAKLGEVTVGVGTAKKHDDTGLVWADLYAAGTKLALAGDFSVPAGANDAAKKQSVFLSNDANCGGVGTASNTVPSATAAEVLLTAVTTSKGLCYVVDGTSQIPAAGPYKVALTVTPATNTATASQAEKNLGSILRDGTELHAPFATIYSGTGNRAVLTSTHSSDANVAASVITETGVTCTGGTSSFTLKAGKQLFINASEVCPTLSTGTRFAMKFIIAAPNNKTFGVYNSYTYDAATAKVTDLSSYPLQRPAN
jgi:hypothetical protein